MMQALAPQFQRQAGFSLLEMAFALIVMGIIAVGVAPMMIARHTQSQETADRAALLEAQTALVNYALSFGGFPDPLDAAGAPVAAGEGIMPPATGTGAVSALGVNNWGANGARSPFRLDINDRLRSSYINNIASGSPTASGGDKVVFCQAVNQQLAAVSGGPSVCQDLSGNHLAAGSACASSAPTAMVVFSTGTDRVANQGNDSTTTWFARVYENDRRGINNSGGDERYDDQVLSYPLTALARDCREKMGALPEVMACAPGQKALVVTNTAGGTRYYSSSLNTLAANLACTPLLDQASSVPVCQDRSAQVSSFSDSACTASAGTSGALDSAPGNGGRIVALLRGASVSLF